KPYKKDARKWRTKKKKHGNNHFELGPRGVLGLSCLKLSPGKLKSRGSGPLKETNAPPCGATGRIKLNIQKFKEYLGESSIELNLPVPHLILHEE
ncbi:hypothetical protein TorRG33x02_279510, partial [Trema orientale]